MPDSSSSLKKRGAPPGNTNALKHGFYSPRHRKTSYLSDPTDLAGQIDLLHVYIQEVRSLAVELSALPDCPDHTARLRILSLSMHSLNRILRLHQKLLGPMDEKIVNRSNLSRCFDAAYLALLDQSLSTTPDAPAATDPTSPSA
jgi:hypothetical protein